MWVLVGTVHIQWSSGFYYFQLLVLIVVGVGLVFSVIFHVGVREKSGEEDTADGQKTLAESSALITIEQSTLDKLKMSWKCWLKEHQFYQVH